MFYQYNVSLSWTRGSHNLKFGATLHLPMLNLFQDEPGTRGDHTFNGVSSGLGMASVKETTNARLLRAGRVIASPAHLIPTGKGTMFRSFRIRLLAPLLLLVAAMHAQQVPQPGSRTVMDAHNCYPYFEWWSDRIDRALSAGTPLAIEQDLGRYTDARTGKSWSVVTHGNPITGEEPTMEQYFFARVRPIVEQALNDGNRGDWPLITLNLDFKDNKPEHLSAVLALLRKYQAWLTSAPKGKGIETVQPLDIKPILVLTGEPDAQQTIFYDQLQPGDRVLAFGAIHTEHKNPQAAPDVLDAEKANNYRRLWNNPWRVVEVTGQPNAGEWTPEKMARLRALVERAHANGLWIRFYTLDGATKDELSCRGWFRGYNFGLLDAARLRWRAAISSHVDYLASDQYELLGAEIRGAAPRAGGQGR